MFMLKKSFFLRIACLFMLAVLWALPVSARSSGDDAGMEEPGAAAFGGPASVGGTLEGDRRSEAMVPADRQATQGSFDFKKQVEDKYGLAFGFDYNAIYQKASESPGKDAAAGGVFRAFGQWTLTGRGTENTGTLVNKVENRHRLGTEITPQDLGFEAGVVDVTDYVDVYGLFNPWERA